jgi:hypothetical protein
VTITDGEGKRYSLDVNADSSYYAAHLFVRNNPTCRFPIPAASTQFDVVTDGRIRRVAGARLKKWIENRRSECNGPLQTQNPAQAIGLAARHLHRPAVAQSYHQAAGHRDIHFIDPLQIDDVPAPGAKERLRIELFL